MSPSLWLQIQFCHSAALKRALYRTSLSVCFLLRRGNDANHKYLRITWMKLKQLTHGPCSVKFVKGVQCREQKWKDVYNQSQQLFPWFDFMYSHLCLKTFFFKRQEKKGQNFSLIFYIPLRPYLMISVLYLRPL